MFKWLKGLFVSEKPVEKKTGEEVKDHLDRFEDKLIAEDKAKSRAKSAPKPKAKAAPKPKAKAAPKPKAKAAPKPKAEAKPAALTKASLSKLTKAQLEEKGREFGIEIDRRKKKDSIVDEVLKASKSK